MTLFFTQFHSKGKTTLAQIFTFILLHSHKEFKTKLSGWNTGQAIVFRQEDSWRRRQRRTCCPRSWRSSHSRRGPRWCPSCSSPASRRSRCPHRRRSRQPGHRGRGFRGCIPRPCRRPCCRTGTTRGWHRWQHCKDPEHMRFIYQIHNMMDFQTWVARAVFRACSLPCSTSTKPTSQAPL